MLDSTFVGQKSLSKTTPTPPQTGLLFPVGPGAAPEGDIAHRPWKVHELVTEVRLHVEREYRDVRVEGEISNLRQAASGHLYFTLKDAEGQLPVVLFRAAARALGFRPKDGLQVMARGKVSVYEDRGQLQLVAETLQPRGAGSLQVAFEQLYERLKEEGLFDTGAKRPLPMFPRVVGVLTSPAGAVIHDILNVLGRRHARVQVLLYPVAVQGEGAAEEIARGLAWFHDNHAADVLVLARGGGPLEDLAPFNSETVARAIRACGIPVVSAVGHETDFTIADHAADLRAPTPSAAAELITDALYRIEEYLQALGMRLERAVRYHLLRAREPYARLGTSAVFARMRDSTARRQQRVDELRFRLETAWERTCVAARQRHARLEDRLLRKDVGRQIALLRERQRTLHQRLLRIAPAQLERLHGRLQRAQDHLQALSPLAVLERGYALVYDQQGSLVKDAAPLRPEDVLRVRFAHGGVRARVLGPSAIDATNHPKQERKRP